MQNGEASVQKNCFEAVQQLVGSRDYKCPCSHSSALDSRAITCPEDSFTVLVSQINLSGVTQLTVLFTFSVSLQN